MKVISKYNSKHMNEIKSIILKHINSNLKNYLILSIIFIIGVMIGVIVINNSNEQSKAEISGYISGFIDTIKEDKFQIDRAKLCKISIIENIKIVGIVWLAGSTIIGIPLIYIIIAYKGFSIGYTISAIILTLGTWKRNWIFSCIIIFTKYNCNTSNIDA